MYKILYKSILILISVIIVCVFYLSIIGLKTSKFNDVIEKKISQLDQRLSIQLTQVYLKINLKKLDVKLSTKNPIVKVNNYGIVLSEINLNIGLLNFFKENIKINNLSIISKNNEIKEIISIVNKYRFNLPLIFAQKKVQEGNLNFEINVNFDEINGQILNFASIGSAQKLKIKLLKNNEIQDLNFDFNFKNDNFKFSNINLIYNNIKFYSKDISIKNENSNYIINGTIKNSSQKVNSNLINNFFNNKYKNILKNSLDIESDNVFELKLNRKFKLVEKYFESKLKIKELEIKEVFENLKILLPNINQNIKFENINLNFRQKNQQLKISGKSDYYINSVEKDNIKFSYSKQKEKENFLVNLTLDKILINFPHLKFKKLENDTARLKLEGAIFQNNINFNKIEFINKNNKIWLDNLYLNNLYKILKVEKLFISLINNNKIKNEILISNINNNYIIEGKSFDFSFYLNELLKSSSQDSALNIFDNLNSTFNINIVDVYLDKNNLVKNLNGNIEIKNNLINDAEVSSLNSQNKKLKFTIKKANGEKVTTLYTDNAEPFVKKFNFVKGFKNGSLDFYSVTKDNVSKSTLKIYDFNLKEVPILTKILSLASLQGIADLMTGEGIRFSDFEMNYENKKELINISEIYAIGPAISILMKGYVEKNKLVSLRGTLVPATTINKTIGSIPFLGDLLVGKKIGEGVFGVSFKIKGPPKKLKTTVNPIKTLTPRFITRTLEKIKNP